MPRKPRIQQSEFAYHVTCRTNNKLFRFQRKKHILLFAQVLLKTQQKYGILVHHFILMSNHFHMILSTPHANLSRAMQYLNARVASLYNRLHNLWGHLWGARFRSTILDSEDAYLRAVRYLYRNPVRARLVASPRDFEDSTFSFYAHGRKVDIFVDGDHLAVALGESEAVAMKKRARMLHLVETEPDEAETEQVRRGLRARYFGSAAFLQRMKSLYG